MQLSTLIDDTAWKDKLQLCLNSEKSLSLCSFLNREYSTQTVFPPKSEIFNALNLTPFAKVKVVILGQDPYHGPDQAHGLAFSVKSNCPLPPSLKNIFKELKLLNKANGDLTYWAKQGVLLLNNVLTVRQGEANSHKNKGWEEITDEIIKILAEQRSNLVFVLWGTPAITKKKYIDSSKHLILEAAHPSPLSAYRGFFGCGHFEKINNYLFSIGEQPIDWKLELNTYQPELF